MENICKNCGSEAQGAFCSNCGSPQSPDLPKDSAEQGYESQSNMSESDSVSEETFADENKVDLENKEPVTIDFKIKPSIPPQWQIIAVSAALVLGGLAIVLPNASGAISSVRNQLSSGLDNLTKLRPGSKNDNSQNPSEEAGIEVTSTESPSASAESSPDASVSASSTASKEVSATPKASASTKEVISSATPSANKSEAKVTAQPSAEKSKSTSKPSKSASYLSTTAIKAAVLANLKACVGSNLLYPPNCPFSAKAYVTAESIKWTLVGSPNTRIVSIKNTKAELFVTANLKAQVTYKRSVRDITMRVRSKASASASNGTVTISWK